MLVFFIILSLILFISILIYISNIVIEIDILKITSQKKINIDDFKMKIYFVLGKRFKWFKLEINKEKLEKLKKKNLNKISNLKIIKEIEDTGIIKNRNIIKDIIKGLNLKLEKINIDSELGLPNIILLSFLVAILNITIGIGLLKYSQNINGDDYKYSINPLNTNKFHLKLSINCIISIKIANIINMIIKKRSEKNEGTSNRIVNGNCNEQYSRYGRCKYNYRRAN